VAGLGHVIYESVKKGRDRLGNTSTSRLQYQEYIKMINPYRGGREIRYAMRTARRMGLGASLSPKARMAMSLGGWAMKNRAGIMKTGAMFKRAFRARRSYKAKARFSRKLIGENKGSPRKSHEVYHGRIFASTRTLYKKNLTEIPLNTTTNDIHKRNRHVTFISGFKCCLEITNLASVPMYFNYAILAPKNGDTISTTDFFRGNNADHAVDFDFQLSSNDFHCRPLNTDELVVLKHKRYLLAKSEGEAARSTYINLDFYVPLKRQVRYENTSTTPSTGAVFACFWCDKFQVDGGTISTAATVNVTERYITYFKY